MSCGDLLQSVDIHENRSYAAAYFALRGENVNNGLRGASEQSVSVSFARGAGRVA